MSTKRLRQNAILELIQESHIASQEQLASALRNRGIDVSQSTLSRDIQELGLAKAGNVYTPGPPEARKQTDHTLRLVLHEFLANIDGTQQFIVLKTTPGSAATVAQAVDEAGWSEIVGTVAGENTIFLLCRSLREVAVVRERIDDLLR